MHTLWCRDGILQLERSHSCSESNRLGEEGDLALTLAEIDADLGQAIQVCLFGLLTITTIIERLVE
jgi:hypothetical protein